MQGAKAQTIFRNGHIWASRGCTAGALAIAHGRIIGVGEPADLEGLRGPDTRVVDLAGRTLVPGFVDAHAHLWKIGHLLTTLLDLRRVASFGELRERLREHARRLAPDAWLQGRGYNEARFAEGRGPTRDDLDAVIGDRPVVLMRTCAHIVVCNSRALDLAGIDRNSAAPAGGEIDRDREGRPTGVLRETAMALVHQHVPAPSADEYERMLRAAIAHQWSLGITSTTDAGVAPELADVYLRLDADRRLAGRVNVMMLADGDVNGGAPYVSEYLRLDTVKFFADGGLSGATAALSVPYRHASTHGVLRMKADELYERARGPQARGWRVATHAIGDTAIEHVLQAYERLGPGPVRHRIEHFGLPTPGQLARAARLGVIAAPQAIFIRELGRNFRRYLPDDLLPRVYPIRAMLEAGLTVALSSDAPVVENDSPLAGMQAALLRRDDEGEAVAPDEAISIEDALDGYTIGGALACGAERDQGRLEEGMCADMAVLSGNPLDSPPEELTELGVTQTWVGGRIVYEA